MFGILKKFSSSADETLDFSDLRKRRNANRTISRVSFVNGEAVVGHIDCDEMGLMLYDIWGKNVEDLPIGKDLPRLARKFRIYDDQSGDVINFTDDDTVVPGGGSLLKGKKEVQQRQQQKTGEKYTVIDRQNEHSGITRAVFSVLITLANELGEHVGSTTGYAIAGMSLELFDREVNISDHNSLGNFILRYFGEHGRVTRVLKACNQSILAAPVTQLKKALMPHVEYKDCQKGGWIIHIRIGIDGSVSVIHRKMEQVLRKGKDLMYQNMYRFEWSLNLNFRLMSGGIQKLELVGFSLDLIDLYFDNGVVEMTELEQRNARNTLQNLFKGIHVEFNDKFMTRLDDWKKRRRSSN